MKVTFHHADGCDFLARQGGCTCAFNKPAACAPIISDHAFKPIRRDPGNCNDCGIQRALHVHQYAQ